MLSKNAEKLLKELNTRKKEYLKNNKDSEKNQRSIILFSIFQI